MPVLNRDRQGGLPNFRRDTTPGQEPVVKLRNHRLLARAALQFSELPSRDREEAGFTTGCQPPAARRISFSGPGWALTAMH
jgi:hypothetical protein